MAQWIGQRSPACGIAEVRFGGVLVDTVECDAPSYRSGAALWESLALGPSFHTIGIRLVSANPVVVGISATGIDAGKTTQII